MFDFIIANKEIFKIFYGFIVGIICATIVIKTDRLFRLSFHQGIRYFRNAFFFYAIAFIIRYLIGSTLIYNFINPNYSFLINLAFEYFLIMAGFFLLHSLIWRKIEKDKENYFSSLFNTKISIFYLMTFIIIMLDYLWSTRFYMFLSQIILFLFAISISYKNYKKDNKKHRFLKFYFIAMILSLLAWISNAIALYLKWDQSFLMSAYVLNIFVFLLFLYGVIRFTKKW